MDKQTITLKAGTVLSWKLDLANDPATEAYKEGLPAELADLISGQYALYAMTFPETGVVITMHRGVWDQEIAKAGIEIPSSEAAEFLRSSALDTYLNEQTDVVNPVGSVITTYSIGMGQVILHNDVEVTGYPEAIVPAEVDALLARIKEATETGAFQE
jgi:hypothetical protein